MKQIFKYPVRVADQQSVELPAGALILAVQTQYERICLWALVDPDCPPVTCRVFVFGTGHPIGGLPAGAGYVGTAQLRGGSLVFHVFASAEFLADNRPQIARMTQKG